MSHTRPVFTETEAIRRLADLAVAAESALYVVHVSSGEGAAAVAASRKAGAKLLGETCPQYLYLDDSLLTPPNGHLYSCCPPLRPPGQPEKLWKHVSAGDIQVIATDHCPFTTAAKNTWQGNIGRLPMGLPGVETMPALLLSGCRERNIPVRLAVRAMSAAPARIFGLQSRKGSLCPGCDADLMLYDPEAEWSLAAAELHMATDYSIFEGRRIRGKPIMTVSRGEILVEGGRWLGKAGRGRFLPRERFDHRNITI